LTAEVESYIGDRVQTSKQPSGIQYGEKKGALKNKENLARQEPIKKRQHHQFQLPKGGNVHQPTKTKNVHGKKGGTRIAKKPSRTKGPIAAKGEPRRESKKKNSRSQHDTGRALTKGLPVYAFQKKIEAPKSFRKRIYTRVHKRERTKMSQGRKRRSVSGD